MNYDLRTYRRAIIVSNTHTGSTILTGGKGRTERWCKNIDVIFKNTKTV